MSCSITDATAPALIPASAGEQLNWRTARPELVEGRADGSWFDKLTTSGRSASATALRVSRGRFGETYDCWCLRLTTALM